MTVARVWMGTGLLAASWLLGLDYFQPANYVAWAVFVLAAVSLLGEVPVRLPDRPRMIVALVLLLPVVWTTPWPHKAVGGLLLMGVVLSVAPIPRRWPRAAGCGALAAGVILLAQSLALWAYQLATVAATNCHRRWSRWWA